MRGRARCCRRRSRRRGGDFERGKSYAPPLALALIVANVAVFGGVTAAVVVFLWRYQRSVVVRDKRTAGVLGL